MTRRRRAAEFPRHAELDIRENQIDLRQPTRLLVRLHRLVRIEAEIICDSEDFDGRRRVLDGIQVSIPVTCELVIQQRARSVDERGCAGSNDANASHFQTGLSRRPP